MDENYSPMTEEGLEFSAIDDEDEKFEYAQYIINTPRSMRPEVSESSERAALEWLKDN